MSAPTPYTRSYSFSDYQANNPSQPLPGPQVDNELENIEQSLNGTIDAVNDVRRADGALVNGIVTLDSLDPTVKAGVGAGALASAEAAAQSAIAASESAGAAAGSAGAAAGSAGAASSSAGQAVTARTGAQTARDFASQWASAPEGVDVDDGVNTPDKSAYHYAQVALGAAAAGGVLPDGSITTAKIADEAVTTAKIAAASVKEAKLANQAVTEAKLATDVAAKLNGAMQPATYDPQEIGNDTFARSNHTGTQAISTVVGLQATLDALSNPPVVQTYAASSTWTKPAGLAYIIVEAWGGGGGGSSTATRGGDGGTSSFGGYLSATGGQGSTISVDASGGVGSGGDINLRGGDGGGVDANGYKSPGGSSPFGGQPSTEGAGNIPGGGGGAATTASGYGAGGGYARKTILASTVAVTVAVTVGAAGGGETSGYAGARGQVTVTEYYR